MKKKLNILTIAYLLFLILLFASGSLSGVFSDFVYFLAFLLPFAFCLYMTRDEGVRCGEFLSVSRDGVQLFGPLVFPTILLTILLSYLTSLIIFRITGKTFSVDLGDSYIIALISHALLPAILEEALFRYLPMRMIAPHSPRCAIIVSSIFFALIHTNLFQIPYAFVGGIIFMALDLATESIIPSVIIHFINNALSVSMMFIPSPAIVYLIYVLIAMITVVSLSVAWRNREEYQFQLILITDKGEGVKFTWQMLLFIALTLVVAIISIL